MSFCVWLDTKTLAGSGIAAQLQALSIKPATLCAGEPIRTFPIGTRPRYPKAHFTSSALEVDTGLQA